MKTTLITIGLANGVKLTLVREDNQYKVQANGETFFHHKDYDTARAVLIS